MRHVDGDDADSRDAIARGNDAGDGNDVLDYVDANVRVVIFGGAWDLPPTLVRPQYESSRRDIEDLSILNSGFGKLILPTDNMQLFPVFADRQ